MAELTFKEKLQPSLLDRLTDDDPRARRESRDQRVMSLQKLRASVLRDLIWLMNSLSLDVLQDLEPYPEVARSVLNYGVQGLGGKSVSGLDSRELEGHLVRAIRDFEPRILPETLEVRVQIEGESMSHNAVTMEIEGELWAEPVPERLFLRTELDLDTGRVQLAEQGGEGRS